MASIISATTTSGLVSTADNSGDLQFQTQNGANTITLPSSSGTLATTANLSGLGFKNRVINGAMMIDQRNAGASFTPSSNYTLDRWRTYDTQSSKFTIQQNAGSVTPPAGFTNYLGITSTSAYSIASGDYFSLLQRIEGFNVADLGWGTANAKTVTLSFWVRSGGLTYPATFGGNLANASFTRSYPFSYTISSANTWEYKTITIAGDTTGTWLTTNGSGIEVQFAIGVGSSNSGTAGAWTGGWVPSVTGAVSVVGTNGATLYITGVQLEVGSTATSFDYRPYGTELSLCQRYYAKYGAGSSAQYSGLGAGFTSASTRAVITLPLHTVMRASPTATISNISVSDWETYTTNVSTIGGTYAMRDVVMLVISGSGFPAFTPCVVQMATAAGYIDFTAEL